jgi:hypothetical protein
VADTEQTWRERGYAVQRDTFGRSTSIRNAAVDGYAMSPVVNRTDKKATSEPAAPASGDPPERDRGHCRGIAPVRSAAVSVGQAIGAR